jgi:L-gulonolactone oxidase
MTSGTTTHSLKPWSNWSGSVRFTPQTTVLPDSVASLQQVVRDVAARNGRLRVTGTGHSFAPLVKTSDTLVDLRRFSGIESIDGHRARILAGTPLMSLGKELSGRGYGMTILGDVSQQTLAGAVSTSTHGTGIKLGSISTQVRGLDMVLASGERVRCSATENPTLFDAARVSLGALGIITALDVEIETAYRLKLIKRVVPLEECLAQSLDLSLLYRHFEFFWMPHTRQTLVKLMDWTTEPESSRFSAAFDDLVLENLIFGTACRLGKLRPAWTPALSRFLARQSPRNSTTMVADCHRAFTSMRLVRFQELEYQLPIDRGPDAMRELADHVEKKNVQVMFPVEYRHVKGDDIWLSPFYQRDSASISVHQYAGMEHENYFAAAEAIFRNHGGRPHWGKIHSLGARDLARLYPRWQDFQKLRQELDPKGLFLNPLLVRLFQA